MPSESATTATPETIRACEDRDVVPVAAMLARAFENEVAYCYLMPNAATREAGLRRFFEGNLRVHLPHRCTWVMVDRNDAVLATVTLRPPAGVPISTLTMLRRGLVPFALNHGVGAVKRLLWLKHTYDQIELEAAQHQRHAYVHMMAVRPDRQGQGLGGRLLRHVLDAAQREQPAPIVLTTHLPINVVYYERAGFTVVNERTLVPPQSTAYQVWSMHKP